MVEKKKEALDEFSGELPDDMVDAVSGGEKFYLTPEPDPVPEPAPTAPLKREYHPDPFPIEIIG